MNAFPESFGGLVTDTVAKTATVSGLQSEITALNTQISVLPRIFPIDNHYAAGDGTHDDRAAIMAAHDAADAEGGGIVLRTKGKTYGVRSWMDANGKSIPKFTGPYKQCCAVNFHGNHVWLGGEGEIMQLDKPAYAPDVSPNQPKGTLAYNTIIVGKLSDVPLALTDVPPTIDVRICGGTISNSPNISLADLKERNSGVSGVLMLSGNVQQFYVGHLQIKRAHGHIAGLGTHNGTHNGLIEYCDIAGKLVYTHIQLTISAVTMGTVTAILVTTTVHGLSNKLPVGIAGLADFGVPDGVYYAKTGVGYSPTSFGLYADANTTLPVVVRPGYGGGATVQKSPWLWDTAAVAGFEGDGLQDATIQYVIVRGCNNGGGCNNNLDNHTAPKNVRLLNNHAIELNGAGFYMSGATGGCEMRQNYAESVRGMQYGLQLNSGQRAAPGGGVDHSPCVGVQVTDNELVYKGYWGLNATPIRTGIGTLIHSTTAGFPDEPNRDHVLDRNIYRRFTTANMLDGTLITGVEASGNDYGGASDLYLHGANPALNNLQGV